MVVKVLRQTSIARNGVGAFVLPCKKITLQYCNWGGSSQGLRDFLTSNRMIQWAEKYPTIQFEIVRKSGHPVIKGDYVNGRNKAICVKNLNIDNVENKLKLIRDASGEQLRHRTKNDNVDTLNDSVRGIWSPLHLSPAIRHKV
ncbi:Mrpl51 [Kluyveromyces lactis]|uniref:Large ribosomal subunit protein mL43 n=1 Tax=Kluyveromyces lactis (strain ATCC 8585 / CBS 2359 / DSM 70799 / NBRC 1267 / NRRL Y-1140 / WM37) TaxID=284590 RepID=Q6CKT0_KLULA|nr:mitochondrial 54S ribosomal protein MRPL51 [Kluyveromyces lactis]QEU59158.1 Mrpl51 [Kluyveromyces lactis]CAG98167.1 KLLA0F08349p [Kluyveromyces lactis]|eukprot:XP_455459.1 mitochondrial 54S ribosomal protein MRPL51 [Kluyveromyces lactis]